MKNIFGFLCLLATLPLMLAAAPFYVLGTVCRVVISVLMDIVNQLLLVAAPDAIRKHL